jgi:tetratricopeptide (TPR) repeat protein
VASKQGRRRAAELVAMVARAVHYAHQRGIIHRDLKPGNILMIDTQAKVLDFGLSLIRDPHEKVDEEPPEVIAGTLSFIAPEIFLGEAPGQLSDLYAVGIIGYELFTGELPWEGDTADVIVAQIVTKIPDTSKIANKRLASVIARLIAKMPEDRYPHADDAILAMSDAINQLPPAETIAIRESFLQAARFVGRDAELKQLVDPMNTAARGSGSMWLVRGESGVGKTRLLDELRTLALVDGVTVLRGQNVRDGSSPYHMWRPVLRWLCLITPLDDAEAGVLKALVPDIDSLLGREVAEAPKVNPLFAHERLLVVIETVFTRQQQPTLVILEDLHWAGDESLELLARLGANLGNLPILIVGSYSDDERPDIDGLLPQAQVLRLNRLSNEGISELSAAILGAQGSRPQLVELLQRETEGNVFFVVEVVRALAEKAGKLREVHEITLPDHVFAGGVQNIIQHRLSRVPKDNHPMLQMAAVAGRQLDLKVLKHAAASYFKNPINIEQWLAVCSNTAVLEIHDGTWRFTHDKLKDGVLAEIPPDLRRALHREIATSIEAVYLYAPEHVNWVAYHWTQAGDKEKEAHYAALAGKQALNSSAFQDAVQYLSRALTLTEHEAASEKKRAEFKRQLGDAYLGLGQYADAKEEYTECLTMLQAIDYKWGIGAALNELGNLNFILEAYPDAAECYLEALKTAMSTRALPVALASIAGIAQLMAKDRQIESAIELMTLTLHHSLSDQQTAYKAENLLEELRLEISRDAFAAAEARGKAGNFAEVVKSLLAGSN